MVVILFRIVSHQRSRAFATPVRKQKAYIIALHQVPEARRMSSGSSVSSPVRGASRTAGEDAPVSLRRATAREVEERDAIMYHFWAAEYWPKPLFLEREAALNASPWSKAAKRTYVLERAGSCSSGDDAGSGAAPTIVANAEIFVTPSTLGSTAIFSSVFVDSPEREKGYGTLLMRLLVEELQRDESVVAALLFSDVGPAFYNRCGFRASASPSEDVVCDVATTDASAVAPPLEGVQMLDVDLSALRPHFPAGILNCGDAAVDVHSLSARAPGFEPLIALQTIDQVCWHTRFSLFEARVSGKPVLPAFGAFITPPVTAPASPAYIAWTADYEHDQLLVLHLDAKTADEVTVLMTAAKRVAAAAGLPRVRMFSAVRSAARPPSAATPADASSSSLFDPHAAVRAMSEATVEAREGALPMWCLLRCPVCKAAASVAPVDAVVASSGAPAAAAAADTSATSAATAASPAPQLPGLGLRCSCLHGTVVDLEIMQRGTWH